MCDGRFLTAAAYLSIQRSKNDEAVACLLFSVAPPHPLCAPLSPNRAPQCSGAGAGAAVVGVRVAPVEESNGGGDRKQGTRSSGKRRAADAPSGATANGVNASSHRPNGGSAPAGASSAGDDGGAAASSGGKIDAPGAGTGAVAVAVAALTEGNGKGKESEPSEGSGGRSIDGPRREEALPARSGDPQERGTKRFSEVELEEATAVEAVGGGAAAGARGVVLRARGKTPRGRNLTASATSMVAAGHAGLAAVEGGGADGSNRRKTRGRSPM